MSITTGYNTTQNGQVVDIGTLFSSSPSSYWIGSVIWQLNTNPPTFFQNPAAIVQSNITQTTTNTNWSVYNYCKFESIFSYFFLYIICSSSRLDRPFYNLLRSIKFCLSKWKRYCTCNRK